MNNVLYPENTLSIGKKEEKESSYSFPIKNSYRVCVAVKTTVI